MKLIDLIPLIGTNHFRVDVVEDKSYMFDDYMIDIAHKRGNYNVINIDCSSEVEDESPITRSRALRPIIVVTIKKEE